MSLIQQVTTDLKQAMRDKDELIVSVLRQLKTAVNNEAIALKKKDEGLNEEETAKVIKREAKKRKDSIDQYVSGNREDLAKQEQAELDILSKYLPEELSEDAIKETIEAVIDELGDSAQFGQVMGMTMKQLEGQADGEVVKRLVNENLG